MRNHRMKSTKKIENWEQKNEKMHFVDFLLQLLCFICWTLKKLYIFSFEYLIPIIGSVLPVIIKYLSQAFTLILRAFFMYIAPCTIQLINGTTYVFNHILNGINFCFVSIVDSDMNLEYAHAIAMTSILVAIIYFNVTGKLLSFGRFIYDMIMLYVRFILNISKIIKYIYTKIFVNRSHEDTKKVDVVISDREKRLIAISRRFSNGSNNGTPIQKYSENNNNSFWNKNDFVQSTPKTK